MPAAFVFSALLALIGYFLVCRYAPEAGGSGIPEIKSALKGLRPVRWWRVIPVKFINGMGALFAAAVRASLTGIVLVLEMTDNY